MARLLQSTFFAAQQDDCDTGVMRTHLLWNYPTRAKYLPHSRMLIKFAKAEDTGCPGAGPTGKLQSPVDISGYETRDDCNDLAFYGYHQKNGKLVVTNSGNTARVDSDVQSFMVGGPLTNVYRFSQMHFHWGASNDGSEHAIDSKVFAMELHLVHYNSKYSTLSRAMRHSDGIAVAAVLFQLVESPNNDLQNHLAVLLKHVVKPKSVLKASNKAMNFVKSLLESPNSYYYYNGSLTTNPFCENVLWIILHRTLPISLENLAHFRSLESLGGSLILSNRRQLQEKFNRSITFCKKLDQRDDDAPTTPSSTLEAAKTTQQETNLPLVDKTEPAVVNTPPTPPSLEGDHSPLVNEVQTEVSLQQILAGLGLVDLGVPEAPVQVEHGLASMLENAIHSLDMK